MDRINELEAERDALRAELAALKAAEEREAPIVVGVRVSSDGFGSYIADSSMGMGALYPGDVREPLMTVAQHERIVASLTCPAQTEQQPVYAAPIAQTPADGLVEALEQARLFIRNGVALGYIQMPDVDTPDPAHDTLPKIDAAIAAHRAQGERK